MTQAEPKKLNTAAANAAAEARAQADAYDAIFATPPIQLDNDMGELKIPPHPDFGMLDDEATDRYEELLFERDTVYAREPDIQVPEQTINGITHPGETIRGQLKTPYRTLVTDDDGNTTERRLSPPWTVLVVQAALGELDYKRLKEGGKSSADVWKIWGKQSLEAKERQGRSSGNTGSVGVETVSEADS